MGTRLGLISDVHASPAALREALDIFAAERVDDIVCAGDIAGYYDALTPVVEMLIAAGCKTISGNHDTAWLDAHRDDPAQRVAAEFLGALPRHLEFVVEGCRVYVVHAEPPDGQHGGIKLLDPEGNVRADRCADWRQRLCGFPQDVLIVGHTHQVYAERLGEVFVVNPGSVPFNHACMILALPELEVRSYALGGREIVRCWNFGMLRG